jgi:hypothetical protein
MILSNTVFLKLFEITEYQTVIFFYAKPLSKLSSKKEDTTKHDNKLQQY